MLLFGVLQVPTINKENEQLFLIKTMNCGSVLSLSYVSSDIYRKGPLFSDVETLPPSKCFYLQVYAEKSNLCDKIFPIFVERPASKHISMFNISRK